MRSVCAPEILRDYRDAITDAALFSTPLSTPRLDAIKYFTL